MKVFFLLLVLGLAAASSLEKLDDIVEEAVDDFSDALESFPSLRETLGEEDYVYDSIEYDIKSVLSLRFKELLQKLLGDFKSLIGNLGGFLQQARLRVKAAAELLKQVGLDAKDKAKKIVDDLIAEIKQLFNEALGGSHYDFRDLIEELLEALKSGKIKQALKDLFTGKLSLQEIVEGIKRIFGDGSELGQQLIQTIKNFGLAIVRGIINRILGRGYYALGNLDDVIRNLGLGAREKFQKFIEWLRNAIAAGVQGAKEKLEKLRSVIKEVAEKLKDQLQNMSKEVAKEAVEFLRPFAEELGDLFKRLEEAVKEKLGGI